VRKEEKCLTAILTLIIGID